MSGVLSVLAGVAATPGYAVTVGSFVISGKVNIARNGYEFDVDGVDFGAISRTDFNGATIRAIRSFGATLSTVGAYQVIVTGNRSAGFVSQLAIGGSTIPGSFSAPSYNSTKDITTFTINVSSETSRFGTTDGVVVNCEVS